MIYQGTLTPLQYSKGKYHCTVNLACAKMEFNHFIYRSSQIIGDFSQISPTAHTHTHPSQISGYATEVSRVMEVMEPV